MSVVHASQSSESSKSSESSDASAIAPDDATLAMKAGVQTLIVSPGDSDWPVRGRDDAMNDDGTHEEHAAEQQHEPPKTPAGQHIGRVIMQRILGHPEEGAVVVKLTGDTNLIVWIERPPTDEYGPAVVIAQDDEHWVRLQLSPSSEDADARRTKVSCEAPDVVVLQRREVADAELQTMPAPPRLPVRPIRGKRRRRNR